MTAVVRIVEAMLSVPAAPLWIGPPTRPTR